MNWLFGLLGGSSDPGPPTSPVASPQRRGRSRRDPLFHTLSPVRCDTPTPSAQQRGRARSRRPPFLVPRNTVSPPRDSSTDSSDTAQAGGTDGYSTGGYSSSGYNTGDSCASLEEKGKRSIVVNNGSSYLVSFFVLREKNMSKKSVETKVEKSILGSLNCSIADGMGVRARGRLSEVQTTVEENMPTFELRDHRIVPSLNPGKKDHDEIGTDVKYPKGCKELRVFGFFKSEGGWKRYKNKVYRVGKKKTRHIITAMDHQIEGHL
ncbi:unnamed protein product [Ectocarpus sp. 12 AP-2014]